MSSSSSTPTFAAIADCQHLRRPVGSGKTALTLALCRYFRDTNNIAVVTNDIFTKEDQEFLIRNEALADPARIRAIETGASCTWCVCST